MRKIIHVNMDCFFAAVEMRDNPHLPRHPVGDRRGAMSTAMELKLCLHLMVIPGRMAVYKEASDHIHSIFTRYTSLIEPLSLDEAFMDVTDSDCCDGSATLMARVIRQEIADELRLTASAGVAPVKFLTKIASDLNKPNGQYVLTSAAMPAFLLQLPLARASAR